MTCVLFAFALCIYCFTVSFSLHKAQVLPENINTASHVQVMERHHMITLSLPAWCAVQCGTTGRAVQPRSRVKQIQDMCMKRRGRGRQGQRNTTAFTRGDGGMDSKDVLCCALLLLLSVTLVVHSAFSFSSSAPFFWHGRLLAAGPIDPNHIAKQNKEHDEQANTHTLRIHFYFDRPRY